MTSKRFDLTILALNVAVLFVGSADAFWRLSCSNIQYGRVDSIVNPGGVAAHVHTAQGGSSMSLFASFAEMVD